MRLTMMGGMTLLLAACQGADKKGPAPDQSSRATNYVAEVKALPEARHKALFFRAIRDAGLPCQTVTQAEQIDDGAKNPTWRAQCEDGSAHLVQVTPKGTLYVTSRIPRS